MIYFFIFLYLFFAGSYFYKFPHSKYYSINKVFVFCLFVCIAGLRYNLGVDYFVYVKKYRNAKSLIDIISGESLKESVEDGLEIGFEIYQIILKTVTDNPQLIFFISSIISTILLFKALKYFEHRQFFFFALLTYFCAIYIIMEMQALRQALAAGFIYCGLACRNSSFKRSSLWILIACLFHNSAFLFLVLLPIINQRIALKFQLIVLSISLLIFIFHITWLTSVISFLSLIIPDLAVVERVMNYLTSEGLMIQRGFYLTFLLYLLVYLLNLYHYRKLGYYSKSSKQIIAQNLLWMYLIVSCLTWEIAFFSVRFGWYFLFGLVVCLPNIISFFKKSSKYLAISYIFIFNFLLVRPFIFPSITQLPFSPYQDYISCELFGVKSTGKQRAEQYMSEMGLTVNFEEL